MAVEQEPDNGRAWARLAELWLSFGDLGRALDAAETAGSLSPELARTQTVLGFARLAQIRLSEARTAFESAIGLESDAPLARLGLGLAKIRGGDLEEGRQDIEMAVALNPDDALIRSYLGKAYFEEKRDPLPAGQFNLAKELDPNDPTPWFYDAIRKQTLNRPVEALQDLQKSIELNDNRAVYRSRLLLDSDAAARSASLGRIYRDLGFEQLALVHGWNSLNSDPSNHSGHRFLADTYSALPGHEIARVSELLQAQLLQPVNITPLLPSLAETDLAILPGAGPTDPAFLEFNPLFNRNRVTFQGSVIGGGEDVAGDEAVFAGVWDKVSFSLGQFHHHTDGFRENADQDRDLYNIFVQGRLSPATSIQGELRSSDLTRGDTLLRFDPAFFSRERRQKEELDSARFGLHHAFTPRSDVIASFIYGRAESRAAEKPVLPPFFLPGSFEVELDQRGWTGEVQHLYRADRIRLITGAGHFQGDVDEGVEFTAGVPFPPFQVPLQSSFTEADTRLTNLYAYTHVDYAESVTITLGASADFFRGLVVGAADQFNPKVGITWNPTSSTTVRAAGFRTLQRSLVLFVYRTRFFGHTFTLRGMT